MDSFGIVMNLLDGKIVLKCNVCVCVHMCLQATAGADVEVRG